MADGFADIEFLTTDVPPPEWLAPYVQPEGGRWRVLAMVPRPLSAAERCQLETWAGTALDAQEGEG